MRNLLKGTYDGFAGKPVSFGCKYLCSRLSRMTFFCPK